MAKQNDLMMLVGSMPQTTIIYRDNGYVVADHDHVGIYTADQMNAITAQLDARKYSKGSNKRQYRQYDLSTKITATGIDLIIVNLQLSKTRQTAKNPMVDLSKRFEKLVKMQKNQGSAWEYIVPKGENGSGSAYRYTLRKDKGSDTVKLYRDETRILYDRDMNPITANMIDQHVFTMNLDDAMKIQRAIYTECGNIHNWRKIAKA